MLFTAAYPKSLDDEAFGYLKRVIVTLARVTIYIVPVMLSTSPKNTIKRM